MTGFFGLKRKKKQMETQNETSQQYPQDPQTELVTEDAEAIVKFGGTIDFDAAPKNSVLVVKISTEDHLYSNNIQMGIIERVLKPRMDILKEKRLTVLFMAANDDISLITEADMLKAGWVKKEPSLIVTP